MVAAMIEVEKEDKTRIREGSLGPARVKGINLPDTQWEWLAEVCETHRFSRSDLVRKGISLLQDAIEREGIEVVNRIRF
jgi:hypothetical protein